MNITRRSLFGFLAAAPIALPAVAKSGVTYTWSEFIAEALSMLGYGPGVGPIYLDGARVAEIIERRHLPQLAGPEAVEAYKRMVWRRVPWPDT